MNQYTTPKQTAKLIELGFEKPKSISGYYQKDPYEYDTQTNTKMCVYDDTQYPIYAYSIGELIEMLPQRVGVWDLEIACDYKFERWLCFLNPDTQCGIATELVDALYNLLIKLKEEGVI